MPKRAGTRQAGTSDVGAWEVRASKPGMATTYVCPSAESALQQVRYFARKDYRTLTVTGPDGRPVTQAALEAMTTQAPAEADAAPGEPLQA